MKRLLDTNAYSELRRGHPRVARLVRESSSLVFSSVVVGELLFGFRCGSKFQRNLDELSELLDSPYVEFVEVGLATADRFSRIAASLRSKGRAIPTNDVWIAAQAMQTGAELISFDEHFGAVDGLIWLHPGS